MLSSALGLLAAFASQAGATTLPLSYLQITQPPTPDGGITTDICPPTAGNAKNVCELPGYGRVLITWIKGSMGTPPVPTPDFYTLDAPGASNGPSTPTAGGDTYTWASVTPLYIAIWQNNAGETSQIAFKFLDGPPDLDKLLLVSLGLGVAGNPPVLSSFTTSEQGRLAGSFAFPSSDPEKFLATTIPNTVLVNSGTSFNSQWTFSKFPFEKASLPFTSAAAPVLNVTSSRIGGDGLGITLAYTQTGILKVCKVAGGPKVLGDKFHFHDDQGNQFSVQAGPKPGGYCVVGHGSYDAGTSVTLTEDIPAGNKVTDIAATPGPLSGFDYAQGTAAIKIQPGVNEITYTDVKDGHGFDGSAKVEIDPDAKKAAGGKEKYGYLEVCKKSKSGQDFTFTVQGQAVTVPAGACSPSIKVVSGQVAIHEQPSASSQMTGCSSRPAYPVDCNIAAQTAIAIVAPGGISKETIVTIKNDP